jgi:hypothetical protein
VADWWSGGVRKFGHYEDDDTDDLAPPSTGYAAPSSEGRAENRLEKEPESDHSRLENSPQASLPGAVELGQARESTVGLVTIRVGADRLPEEVRFAKSWQQTTPPDEYGKSVVDACEAERARVLVQAIDANTRVSPRPTRRQRLLALMKCRSVEEFKRVSHILSSYGSFEGSGKARNDLDNPVVSVYADRNGVREVFIDPNWGANAGMHEVKGEFLDAVDSIREQLRAFTPVGTELNLSDDELQECVDDLWKKLKNK